MRDSSPKPADTQPDEGLQIVRFDDVHDAGTDDRSVVAFDAFEQRAAGFADLELGAAHMDRAAAGLALESMARAGMTIFGIDVVSAIGGRPLYPLQQWRCEPGTGETAAGFASRSHSMAYEFLRAYPDPGDGSIVYTVIAQPADDRRAAA